MLLVCSRTSKAKNSLYRLSCNIELCNSFISFPYKQRLFSCLSCCCVQFIFIRRIESIGTFNQFSQNDKISSLNVLILFYHQQSNCANWAEPGMYSKSSKVLYYQINMNLLEEYSIHMLGGSYFKCNFSNIISFSLTKGENRGPKNPCFGVFQLGLPISGLNGAYVNTLICFWK